MAAKLTRLTLKIAIQQNLVAESHTIFSSCSRQPVCKLLDTPSSSKVTVNQHSPDKNKISVLSNTNSYNSSYIVNYFQSPLQVPERGRGR